MEMPNILAIAVCSVRSLHSDGEKEVGRLTIKFARLSRPVRRPIKIPDEDNSLSGICLLFVNCFTGLDIPIIYQRIFQL